MGFWNIFFSSQQCKNCKSYDTKEIDFNSLSEKDKELFYKTMAAYGEISEIQGVYRCNKCKHLTISMEGGLKFWTQKGNL